MTPTPATPQPGLLPWRLVLLIFGLSAAAGALTFGLAGSEYIPATLSGMILGVFGTMLGDPKKTALAVGAVGLAVTLSDLAASWPTYLMIAPLFALAAGLELKRFGTRASIFAVMSWIILTGPSFPEGTSILLVAIFALSTLTGTVFATWTGISGRAPLTQTSQAYAVAHAAALGVGLILAEFAASLFDDIHAYWIALLFTARALDPPGRHLTAAGRRGAAMVIGAGAAGLLVALVQFPAELTVVGVASILVGLRYLPSGRPISSACMSAGVVLTTSPSIETAIFRAEAAIGASILVVLVFFLGSAILKLMGEQRND